MDIKNRNKINERICILLAIAIPLILACYYLKIWYFPWDNPEIIMDNGSGDALAYTIRYKNLIENMKIWSCENLGAPFEYTIYDLPLSANRIIVLFIFIIGKITQNAVSTMVIFIILSFPITSITSYYCIKQFKLKPITCLLGGISYAFIPFKFYRQFVHYGLGNSLMMIPIAVCLMYWFYANDRFLIIEKNFFKSKKNIIGIVFLIILGLGELYFTYFACIFIAVTLIIKFINEKEIKSNIIKFIIMIGTILVTIVINIIPYFLYKSSIEAPKRAFAESELYAFKIPHLLIPQNTGISIIDKFMNSYIIGTENNNENVSAFLGVVGVIGFLILILSIFYNKSNSKIEKDIRYLSQLNIAGVLLAVMGGFSYLIAVVVTSQFRTYNRISVFLSFFGILAFCIIFDRVIEFKFSNMQRKIIISLISVFVISCTCINGNTKNSLTLKNIYESKQSNLWMYDFIYDIEEEVGKSAVIYQMPYHKYPEAGPVKNMPDSGLFLPYIYSHNNIKWSYGTYKGTLGDIWHEAINELPLEEKIYRLSNKGFSGIYIDRNAYSDEEFEQLDVELKQILEVDSIVSKNEKLYFFSMSKYNEKVKEYDDSKIKNMLKPIYKKGKGIYDTESNENSKWNWSEKESSIYLINDLDYPVTKTLDLFISTGFAEMSNLSIEYNDIKQDYQINYNGTKCSIKLKLKPGINKIELRTDAPKVDAPNDKRNLYFRIQALSLYTIY